jgi:hypothetical protein
MPASDHLNGPLFHGTTFRYGHIKRGDIIKPGSHIDAVPHHDENVYPEAGQWAHATSDLEYARGYAGWTAHGPHEANWEDESKGLKPFKPHVFQVEPVGEVSTDPEHPTGGVRAKGLRVVRRVLPNE